MFVSTTQNNNRIYRNRITDIEDGDNPGLTQNVRLLLGSRNATKTQQLKSGRVKTWDDTACLTGNNRGTYVQTGERKHSHK